MNNNNKIGISLGWNCHSASKGVELGIRNTKANGYGTCPFDEMITNYKGIIECIKDDFECLCDIKYLELLKIPKESKWLNTNGDGDVVIYHTKYHFIFNHESPGHANLYKSQRWLKGINHYVMNDYEEFIRRYTQRIDNIKQLLAGGASGWASGVDKVITFILTRPNTNQMNDITELTEVIVQKYPHLKFEFTFFDFDKYIFYDHLRLMQIDDNDEEVIRLWKDDGCEGGCEGGCEKVR